VFQFAIVAIPAGSVARIERTRDGFEGFFAGHAAGVVGEEAGFAVAAVALEEEEAAEFGGGGGAVDGRERRRRGGGSGGRGRCGKNGPARGAVLLVAVGHFVLSIGSSRW